MVEALRSVLRPKPKPKDLSAEVVEKGTEIAISTLVTAKPGYCPHSVLMRGLPVTFWNFQVLSIVVEIFSGWASILIKWYTKKFSISFV